MFKKRLYFSQESKRAMRWHWYNSRIYWDRDSLVYPAGRAMINGVEHFFMLVHPPIESATPRIFKIFIYSATEENPRPATLSVEEMFQPREDAAAQVITLALPKNWVVMNPEHVQQQARDIAESAAVIIRQGGQLALHQLYVE
jgi:hypothetical protein